MLSPDEHPGIFTFLVGIVVIVLVAVGLATLMEKRFAFSSGGLRLEREVATLDEEVADHRDRLDSATVRFAELNGPRVRAMELLRRTELDSTEVMKHEEELVATRDVLRDEILAAEQGFSEYREDYRSESWADAVGEVIGTLTLRDGRSYLDASITKVTDVGLEIRHQHGFARIHAPDLGQAWQDRFQWDDEKRRTRLKEEALARERMSAPKIVAKSPKLKRAIVRKIKTRTKRPVAEVENAEDLEILRRMFSGWQTKVFRLESERDEAVANSARQRSVPGRLETWNARAARLRVELSKAQFELAAARTRLADVSPRDPLLIVVPVRSR